MLNGVNSVFRRLIEFFLIDENGDNLTDDNGDYLVESL